MLLWRILKLTCCVLWAAAFCGCQTGIPELPHAKWQMVDPEATREALLQRDTIVPLTSRTLDPNKPVLLLLHGATDDPTEMLDIFAEWKEKYNVLLYSFNFRLSVKKIGLDLVKEMEALRKKNSFVTNVIVIDYSYSAIVFRAAVLSADDSLFSGTEVIQLVPTAAGSYLARTMKSHWAGPLLSMLSNVCAAQNPYGAITRELWGPEGTLKYNRRVKGTKTILLEGDQHCLARIGDPNIRQMYEEGIREVVAVVPKSAGVIHDYFTVTPAGLQYLRKVLETLPAAADSSPGYVASSNHRR